MAVRKPFETVTAPALAAMPMMLEAVEEPLAAERVETEDWLHDIAAIVTLEAIIASPLEAAMPIVLEVLRYPIEKDACVHCLAVMMTFEGTVAELPVTATPIVLEALKLSLLEDEDWLHCLAAMVTLETATVMASPVAIRMLPAMPMLLEAM
jgi:hypothetical protein